MFAIIGVVRPFIALVGAVLIAVAIGVAALVGPGSDPVSAASGPGPRSASTSTGTTVACEREGLAGKPSPNNVVLGPATFLGLGVDRQLESVGHDLYADKAFLVISQLRPPGSLEVHVDALAGGRAGLAYGAVARAGLNAHTYRLTGAEATYKFELCQGYPSGYAGGIIASGPTCVQITVKTSAMKWTTRLGFGGLRCPT